MKLIKFKDGTYGVRKWGVWYYDLMCRGFWWGFYSEHFKDCSASKPIAEQALRGLTSHKSVRMNRGRGEDV